jgi:hypothetical protein
MLSTIKMFSRRDVFGALVVAAVFSLAGPAIADGASAEDAEAMVASAIVHFDANGVAALDEFNLGEASAFRKGELYVVVQSTGAEAKIVAHAGNPSLVGVEIAGIVDSHGSKFAVEISDKATADGGWFDYDWLNPASGNVEPKTSWAVRHKDLVFVVGFYRD